MAKQVKKSEVTKSKVSQKDLKKNVGRTIQVIKCSLDSPIAANLTPGSAHIVIDAPKGHKLSEEGVWVEGVGDQAMLLMEEIEFVTDEVEPKKLTLKEKRALRAAEKKAEEDAAAPVAEEKAEVPAPKKKAPKKAKVEEIVEEAVEQIEEKVEEAVEEVVGEIEPKTPKKEPKTPAEDKASITHKICRISGEELPISEFGKDKSTKDGYSSVCKTEEKKYREERKKIRAEKAAKAEKKD